MRDFIRDMTHDGDFAGYALVGILLILVVPALPLMLPFALIGWIARRLS